MANLNDVVRHVILRILVDSENLGSDIGKARAQLKGLEDSEKDAQQRRAKGWEEVAKAAKKYTDSLRDTQDLTERNAQRVEQSAQKSAKAHREAADAAKEETKALRDRVATQAAIERADERAAASRIRQDQNAENARLLARQKANAAIERSDAAAASARVRQDVNAAAARSRANLAAEQARQAAREKADAAIARAAETQAARLNALDAKNRDAQVQRSRTIESTIQSVLAKNQASADIASANAGAANARRDLSTTRAAAADEKRISDEKDRQVKSTALIERSNTQAQTAKRQLAILEERLGAAVANRAAAEERAARASERPVKSMRLERTRRAATSFLDGTAAPLADRDRRLDAAQIGTDTFGPQAETPFRRFFQNLRQDASRSGSAVSESFARIRNGVKRVFDEAGSLRGSGGQGGRAGLIGGFASGVTEFADKITTKGGPILSFFTSFRGLIVVLLTALGPLAAALGAVGAAALGLASNLGALSGVLFALPGLIGALVGGFGALALVMKPISGVMQAYSAAQKAAATASVDGGRQAKQAANAYRDAQRAYEDAQTAYDRAVEDAPRSQRRLQDAYKDAGRQIEDYRLALQRLQQTQEDAQLGVDNAEQAYRRALADPTSNALARKTARSGLVNTLFDQEQTKVSGSRLQEDANQAFQRGVEGSDQVVDARRAVEDATRRLDDATVQLTRSQDDLNEKYKDMAAGSATARQAQDALEAQLAELGPKTRTVIESIFKLSDAWKAMQNRVSDRLFGHLTDDTDRFADGIGVLESFLGPAADAIGRLAEKALILFTNPDWKKFFAEQGEESGQIILALGEAALSFANGLMRVTEVARPFTRFVVGGIKGMAEAFEDFTASERNRDKLAAFLELTQKRMQELWPIVKNFAIGLAGFFKALNTPFGEGEDDFTTKINKGLLGISETFRDLGEKASDPNGGFMKWLKDVGPLLKDIVTFLGDVGRFFGGLFADQRNLDEARKIFQVLGKELLPALRDIFSELAESGVISKIASGLASAFSAVSDFLNSGGTTALGVFASILEGVGKTIDFLSKNIPGLTTAIGALATAAALFAGGALFLKLTGILTVIKGIRYALGGLREGGLGGLRDKVTDSVAGRSPGETSLGRNQRQGTTPGGAGVLPSLFRIESHLKTIIRLLGGTVASDLDGPDRDKDGKKTGGKRGTTPDVDADGRRPADYDSRHRAPSRSKGVLSKVGRFLGAGGDEGFIDFGANIGKKTAAEGVENAAETVTKKTTRRVASEVAEEAAEQTAKKGLLGGAGRLGGSLARGAAGGLGGLAASLALTFGGEAAINKFVKNKDDQGSLSRGLGAVGTGAGIGALVGSVVPGVGTAIGGVVGGLAGGAYSLYKDKNLRSFVGDKLAGAGKFVGSAFTGKDEEGNQLSVGERIRRGAAGLSPVAGLLGKTDIGKTITDSLGKAGSAVAKFFTKTIPDKFEQGVQGIKDFFNDTLPELPGKFFDKFTFTLGQVFGYLTETLPEQIGTFLFDTLPAMASEGWEGIKQNLFKPIDDFINIDLPLFWNETLPKWFEAAPQWFEDNVKKPIRDFFNVDLPYFFDVTLPAAIDNLPTFLYDNLVAPVLNFFKSLKDHIGDALSGSWDWAKNLFTRGSESFAAGAASASMSGGLVKGVYRGIEDTQNYRLTPEEFVVRRSKVMQPGGKAFLRDFNEGRIDVSQIYAGLASQTAPQVMSVVPRVAPLPVSSAGHTTIDNSRGGLTIQGGVTINNPKQEKSERSIRRALQVAAIRHRL